MKTARFLSILTLIVILGACLSLQACSNDDDENLSLPEAAADIELWELEDGTIVLRTSPIANANSYTWYLDGKVLTSTCEPYFAFSESGEYRVAGTNGMGTGEPSKPIIVDASGRPAKVAVEVLTSEEGIVTLKAAADNAWGYRWFLNGELMQRGSQSEYLPLEDGTYTVQPYNSAGNGESVEVSVKIGVINLLDPRVVPDERFRMLLIALGDSNTFFSNLQAQEFKELSFQGTGVADLTGIRFFTNLETLNLNYCGYVKYLDLRALTNLKTLDLFSTESLIELNIRGLHKIQSLNINSSSIGTVDISGLTESLERFNAGYSRYKEADLTSFKKLKYVNLSGDTRLETIKLNGLANLEQVLLSVTGIKELDLTGCNRLKSIVTSFSESLTSLTLPASAPLEELKFSRCSPALMTAIDLTPYQSTLKELFADAAGLKDNLTFENYPVLKAVQLDGNKFSSLTLKNCPSLTTLRAAENSALTSVQVENLPNLATLYCYQTSVRDLDFSSCENLVQAILFENKELTAVNFDGCKILSWVSLEYCANLGPRLDISATTNIESFNCEGSQVKQIKINKAYNCAKVPFNSKIPKGARYVHEFE